MPQQPSDFDFSGLARAPVAGAAGGPSSDGFDFSGLARKDTRSGFARGWDTATTPLVDDATARQASAAIAGHDGPLAPITGGFLDAYAPTALKETASAFLHHPIDATRAAAGGIVEGLAKQFTSPVDLALLVAGPLAKGAGRLAQAALPAIRDAEQAIVAARAAGRSDEVARLVQELAAARQTAGRAAAVRGAVRGVELGAGGGMVARGAERAVKDEQPGDVPAGVAEGLMGLLGMHFATPALEAPRPVRIRGALTGEVRPSFVVTPEGVAGTPEAIPMRPAADGSFVRAEPGVYARRDVKGLLPEGSHTVTPDGVVVRPGGDVPAAKEFDFGGLTRDPSFVRAEPAEYARHEVRGLLPPGPRFVAGEGGQIASLERAADLPASPARPQPTGGSVAATRAAIAGREFDGAKETRRIFSGDPSAVDAPKVDLDPRQRVELQRLLAEMEHIPYTSRTFNETTGRGGAFDIVAGGGGAPVFQDITGGGSGSRGDVIRAIQGMLEGRHSALGQRALDEANRYLEGKGGRRLLPDDAGVRNPILDGAGSESDFHGFSQYLEDMAALEPEVRARNGPAREPGEEGAVNPLLLQHVGGAAAGAVVGGATGDDPANRTRNALIGAAVGAAVPGALRLRNARMVEGAMTGAVRIKGARSVDGVEIPTTGRKPGAPDTPLRDPMAGVEVFLEKFAPEIRSGLRDVFERNGGFEAQRRGAIPQAQADRLAQGVLVDFQRRVKPGTTLNVEGIRAHTDALATAQAKVNGLAATVARGQNSDADIVALEAAKAEVSTLGASLMGARSEAGRALAQFRILARVLDSNNPRLLAEAAGTLRGDAAQFAQAFTQLPDDPVTRFRWLQAQDRPGVREQVRQYYYANILSGVKTHERNILGNVANTVNNLMVHPAAAGLDALKSAATGAPRQVTLDEIPSQLAGMVGGFERGLSEALFSLKHGVNRSALTQSLSAAEAGKLDVPRVEFGGGGANPFNWPGRALDSADQFFRAIAKQQEAYGLAHAQAKREGLKGAAFEDRMAGLLAGDGEHGQRIAEQADTFARRAVFQEKAGPLVGLMQSAAKKYPELSFVVPFMKTPANIFRQGFEFSPAGFAMKAVRQEGRAGTQAQARAALGSAALGGLAYLAATGRLSGSGPRNPAERAQLMESGWRPNSVKVGDHWIEYSLFQPVSIPAAAIGNAFEAWRGEGMKAGSAPGKIAAALQGFARSGLDQSFLSGVADLFEMVEGRSLDSAAKYVGQQAHGLLPFAGAQRSLTAAVDPTVRAPQGIMETVKAGVPGLSSSVEPRLTRFGQEVTRPGGPVRRAADPFNVSAVTDDPVVAELGRLGVSMGPQSAQMALPPGQHLTRQEDFDVRKLKGTAVGSVLDNLIALPAYHQLPDSAKADVLERAIQQARGAVTDRVKPTIRARILSDLSR